MKTRHEFIQGRIFPIFLSITILFGAVVLNRGAYAAEPVPTSQARGGYHMMVGDIEVIALSDGTNMRLVDQQLQLLQGDKKQIQEALVAAYPDGQIETTVNAFLINTGSKVVLIDTGNGKAGSPTMGNVINNLAKAGYQPENIDEIYLTHMHGDHVGGLVAGGERVFPNATVYANALESEYWLSDSNMEAAPANAKRGYQAAKAAITPYFTAGKFETFAGNLRLTPGIRAEVIVGHTPGHTAYFIESRGETLVLWGDLIHVATVQFEDPTVTISYDSDQGEAEKSRQRLLAEVMKNDWLIGGAHLAFPSIGHVRSNHDKGYIFLPLVSK